MLHSDQRPPLRTFLSYANNGAKLCTVLAVFCTAPLKSTKWFNTLNKRNKPSPIHTRRNMRATISLTRLSPNPTNQLTGSVKDTGPTLSVCACTSNGLLTVITSSNVLRAVATLAFDARLYVCFALLTWVMTAFTALVIGGNFPALLFAQMKLTPFPGRNVT